MSYCKLNKCACTCIDLLSVLEVCTRIARKSHTYSCIHLYSICVITEVLVLMRAGDKDDKGDKPGTLAVDWCVSK